MTLQSIGPFGFPEPLYHDVNLLLSLVSSQNFVAKTHLILKLRYDL